MSLVTLIALGGAAMIVNANIGHRAAPPGSAVVSARAIPAGRDFTPYAPDSARGITQSQGRVASTGAEIVAVGAEQGQQVPRAQFFVSPDGGRSWTLGTQIVAGGGAPPPGHAARFVAGGQGRWAAIGPDSVWTSTDGRAWTLASATGLPQLAGDEVTVLKRTGSGFVAAGVNMSGGNQANATPVLFLSAEGARWHRLGAGQLHLPAGNGRVLDIRLVAARGNTTLITGDVATQPGGSGHRGTVRTGAAWLSDDGGRSWAPVSVPTGHGAQPQFSDAAATAAGFVLVRPARVGGVPAADVYRSSNGTTWTFAAALTTPAGFSPGLMNGGPAGAALTGRSGPALTAFVSRDGVRWRQTPVFGNLAETVSGVAMTGAGAVIAAGTSSAVPGSSQQLITAPGSAGRVRSLSLAAIPGAVEPQLAVNALAAQGGTQVAVGSANGFPAAWLSADAGRTWYRAAGQAAVLDRPGIQQLTSVAHGSAGWLAVGGVTAGARQHPVVLTSSGGSNWSAADGLAAFAGAGLFTQQAAAGHGRYVIVGYRQGARGTTAVAWRSSGGLTRWQRAADTAAGTLDGGSSKALDGGSGKMLAVAATADGFVAVGSRGGRPAVWMTQDGSTWTRAALPLLAGAGSAVLWHVAAAGRTVVATGSAQIATAQVPFAASSADGGRTWHEVALPHPGAAQVTALAAAGGTFAAAGTTAAEPGRRDVVVWTSRDGRTWRAATLAGPGLAGRQAITGLAASGRTLTGVGFAASPASEEPTLWQIRIR